MRSNAALLPALLAGLVIGLIVTISGGGGEVTTASKSAATPSPPEQPARTEGARWLAGPAGRLLRAVDADLGRLSAARRGRDRLAASKNAAKRLVIAASAALDGPMPPSGARLYITALEDFERACRYIEMGDFGAASRLLAAGNTAVMKVTAAADRPPTGHPPAAVNAPSR